MPEEARQAMTQLFIEVRDGQKTVEEAMAQMDIWAEEEAAEENKEKVEENN